MMALTASRFDFVPRLKNASENNPPLRAGERGIAVAVVQQCFVDLGHKMPGSTGPDGNMDGIFGQETTEATRAFQSKNNLTVDGIVGRQTLTVLDAFFSRTAGITVHEDGPRPRHPPPPGWKNRRLRGITPDQRNSLADILTTDSAINRIDYYLGPGQRIHIDGTRLSYVGELIRNEQIRVYATPNLASTGVHGIYSSTGNLMVFDFYEILYMNSSDASKRHWIRSSIVHEAAHAAIDLSLRQILDSWNEVAAYLAGHIYLRHHNASWLYTPFPKHRVAADIVEKHKMHEKRGVRLHHPDFRKLLAYTRGDKWWQRGKGDGLKKAEKDVVRYQSSPINGRACAQCVSFVEGGTCETVEGSISPSGHCLLFAA